MFLKEHSGLSLCQADLNEYKLSTPNWCLLIP